MSENTPEDIVVDDPVDGSPYDTLEVVDGVGVHDPDATDLDRGDPNDGDWS